MAQPYRVAIISDIHYASAREQARGDDYEFRLVTNPLLRFIGRMHRRFVWLHRPLHQGYLLDRFLEIVGSPDCLVANGDFSCNTAFVGVSDEAACESARECLGKLRRKFGARLRTTIGDHELGKTSLFGGCGGMRVASWHCAREVLGLEAFWQLEVGRYTLLGVVSSLVALPAMGRDLMTQERDQWEEIREGHLVEIRQAFDALAADRRVLLFCHDPTALPFLWREESVRAKLAQVEQTVIGHLHSTLILKTARLLAGMPVIKFLGPTAQRISGALHQARYWRQFRVRLCPALAGIELLKDGGHLIAELDPEACQSIRFRFHPLPRARVGDP